MQNEKIIKKVNILGKKTKYVTIPKDSEIEVGDYVVIKKLETETI